MTKSETVKPRHWKRWLFAIVLLLCVVVFAGWIYVKGAVEGQLETQLSNLGLGAPKIQSVSIGADGVQVNRVEFFQADESEPWVSFERLTIQHPLGGLAAGDEVFDGLEIDGLQTIVDLDNLTSSEPFDLSSLDIPAKQFTLTNAAVAIRQSSRTDQTNQPSEIKIEQVNGVISKTDSGLEIDGTIGDLIGGEWKISGTATPDQNEMAIVVETQSAKLVDGQWQNWPGMPSSIEKYFQANADVAAKIELTADDQNQLTYDAKLSLSNADLSLPTFDLPIEITEGQIRINNGIVGFEDVLASTGKDSLKVAGSTKIDEFPIRTNFEAEFSELDVATLRKLADAIPTQVTGHATGNITGTVEVEESLRTTISLNGKGESSTASYGSIQAETTTVDVEITPLVFDSQQEFESIAGSVTVNANANDQSASQIFSSLELNDLAKQLELETSGSGKFRLALPLATADKIETWQMQVSAVASQASFSQQKARDIRVDANLANGNLNFTEIVATPIHNPTVEDALSAPKVRASIQWPLSSTTSPSDIGNLKFTGELVPIQWLIGLIDRQIQNAGVEDGLGIPTQSVAGDSQLTGTINFSSSVNVDANDPTAIDEWAGTGNIANSIVSAAGQQLENLQSQLKIANGKLEFVQLGGSFSTGGNLTSNGVFNLADGSVKAADLSTSDMPLSWIVGIASESVPDIQAALKQIDIKNELVGKLSAKFQLTPPTERQTWSVETQMVSEQLGIKGQFLNNISLSGNFDSNQINIQKAHAELDGEGQFDLDGEWQIAKKSGKADLKWKRLPLKWLASFGLPNAELIAGSTSGDVRISNDLNVVDGSIPISVVGAINAEGLQVADVKSRELGFDIRTEDGVVLLERFRSEGDLKEVNLLGQLKLKPPFAFAVDGTIERLPLSRIFERPSVADLIASSSITGDADAKVNLQGDLESFDWESKGEIKLSNLIYNRQPISEINASWILPGGDWAKSTVIMNAFGGSIKMVELSQKPQRIKVELADIESKELTSLVKLPAKLTGKLSGDASLNEWSAAATRWADVNLRGASLLVGPAEFGELEGSVEYRKEQLKYSVDGRLLNGKIAATGKTTVPFDNLLETELPVNVQFTNGTLSQLYRRSRNFESLRLLQGSLAANADLVLHLDRAPTGNGVVNVNNLSWNNEILTKQVSTDVKFNSGVFQLSNLRADLRRGEISGRASIPIQSNAKGSYQLNFRSFDLQRFLDVVIDNPVEGAGLLDARISGQLGRSISGQGNIAISRAKLLGLAGRRFQVPVQFQFQPQQNTGRIAFRQSRFQMFNGNVSGSASLDFGRTVSLESDLQVAKIDTELLFSSLADLKNSGQGKLSGHLVLKGNSIRSLRDLKGSFTGKLDRAAAFELPLLSELGRFLGGNQLQTRDFESDDIDLRLNQGKLEVRRLNFSNALAQIAVTCNYFVDVLFDLHVAGKIDRLDQPTLIDQLAGSPLSRFTGSPVAVFAQAADFLSERLVFVRIGGTFRRPQVRPDSGKQLQSEAIRYFLRGTQILPNADPQDN